jgi:multidrug transporter EmrE-like cation transporter
MFKFPNTKRKVKVESWFAKRHDCIWCMCDRASYMKMTRGTNLMQQLWFIIISSSTCFGHLYVHLQEFRLCTAACGVQALGVVAVVLRSWCVVLCTVCEFVSDTYSHTVHKTTWYFSSISLLLAFTEELNWKWIIWDNINVKLRGLWETRLSVTHDLKLQEIFTCVASIVLTRLAQLMLHKKKMYYFHGSVAYGILQHRGCVPIIHWWYINYQLDALIIIYS